jgi:multiple antibiotic resistance protein
MLATILTYTVPILVIVDPIGNIPVFLVMTGNNTPRERDKIIFKACLIAFVTLCLFVFLGSYILKFFGISVAAFQIASGLLLFSVSMDMLRVRTVKSRTSNAEAEEGVSKEDVSVFPLAIPMLSGPGAISAVMTLASRQGAVFINKLWVAIGVLIAFVISYITLRYAVYLMGKMGTTGINIIQRIMGLILVVISVQFIINGVDKLLPGGLNLL